MALPVPIGDEPPLVRLTVASDRHAPAEALTALVHDLEELVHTRAHI